MFFQSPLTKQINDSSVLSKPAEQIHLGILPKSSGYEHANTIMIHALLHIPIHCERMQLMLLAE